MSIPFYKLKDIPKETFVVRIKQTNHYIHINKTYGLFIKAKMSGCLVLRSKDDANDMINIINKLELEYLGEADKDLLTEYEVIPFDEAYKSHGIVEKQIVWN